MSNSRAQSVALGITFDPLYIETEKNFNPYSFCGTIQFDSTNAGLSFRHKFVSQRKRYLNTDMYVLNLGVTYRLEDTKRSKFFFSLHGACGIADHKFHAEFIDGLDNRVIFGEQKNHLNCGIGFEMISMKRIIGGLFLYTAFGITRQLTASHSFSNEIDKFLFTKPFNLNTIDLNIGLVYQIN